MICTTYNVRSVVGLKLMEQTDSEKLRICRDILDTCASINLRRFSRLVTNEYNEALRPTGLRTTQLAVLVAIGAAHKQSLTDIAEILSMDISTLTRSIAILEEKGLATCHAAGGRKKHVILTNDGYNTILQAQQHWNTAQDQFNNRIGHEMCNTLCKAVHSYRKPDKAA